MWYLFNYIWIFIWALFNYISFNEGYKCGVLLNWISIICQLSLQQDIKQIRALTKGRSGTKCSIITMIKIFSTKPTEAVQTLCNQWRPAKYALLKAKVEFLMSALPSLIARMNWVSVSFLFSTSGISQSSWLNYEAPFFPFPEEVNSGLYKRE